MKTIFLKIDIPNYVMRPGVPMAQVMREVLPIIETMIPMKSGFMPDRITGETKAEWTYQET